MKNTVNKKSYGRSQSSIGRGLLRFCVLFLCVPCVCAALLSSCGKEPTANPIMKGLEGEWQLESFAEVPASEEEIDVYIKFENGRFELFQKLGGGHFSKYDGTYSVSGTVLSGKYSDGVAFGSSYSIVIEDDVMTMHSLDSATKSSSDSEENPTAATTTATTANPTASTVTNLKTDKAAASTVSEVCVYVRSSIPDSVRQDAADYSGTRSSESLDDAVNLPKFPWNGNLLRAM